MSYKKLDIMRDFITNTEDARLIDLGHCARNGGATHAPIEAKPSNGRKEW